MRKQVYLNMVDGFHVKCTPLRVHADGRKRKCVTVRVDETACGYVKGEELRVAESDLFCITGHSRVSGKIKAVGPDLSQLPTVQMGA